MRLRKAEITDGEEHEDEEDAWGAASAAARLGSGVRGVPFRHHFALVFAAAKVADVHRGIHFP